jgi:shikimate kinase
MGFPGCMVDQVSKQLARRLWRQTISIENEVERRKRLSIHRLTGLGKPPQPNVLEEHVIRDITYRENLVAVLGHSIQLNGHSGMELREHSYTVFLDTPFAILWERMERDPDLSDLVLEQGRRGVYSQWLAEREHFEQCDLQLLTADDPDHLSKLIAHCFIT